MTDTTNIRQHALRKALEEAALYLILKQNSSVKQLIDAYRAVRIVEPEEWLARAIQEKVKSHDTSGLQGLLSEIFEKASDEKLIQFVTTI